MISILLLKQLLQLFFCILLGWILVRSKLLKAQDSRTISILTLYLVTPCVIVTAFQIKCNTEILLELAFSLGLAVFINVLLFVIVALLRRPLHLNPIDQASIIYTNCGNLMVPVVAAILGKEWTIFTSMYFVVHLVLIWSHGRILISNEKDISLRKIFVNVNIISIVVGATLFLLNIPLPTLLIGAMDSVANMNGPLCMVVIGMLIGETNMKNVVSNPRVWKVIFLRLVACPIIILLVLKYSALATLLPRGEMIMLISLLGGIAPSAATITQMAQVYKADGKYASAINLLSTLLCIITMPILVALYQM